MGNKIPPTATAMPPMPTTELTDCLGNISEAMVNILVAHAWCTATTVLIRATAIQTLDIYCAPSMDSSMIAKISNTVLRALSTAQPRYNNTDEKYPPNMLPIVVAP